MKKIVIFDMDGTLVDSSITIVNAINYVRNKLSLPPMSRENILTKLNDHTINSSQYFYETDSFKADHEIWFGEYYKNNHKQELRLYDGIEELLFELKDKQGFQLAVATNAYKISTKQSLMYLDIIGYFDSIVCGDEVPRAKPYPDMLYKILDERGIDASEAIFVGDGERDEEASKNANIDYIMVHWGFSTHKKEDAVSTIDELKKKILEF